MPITINVSGSAPAAATYTDSLTLSVSVSDRTHANAAPAMFVFDVTSVTGATATGAGIQQDIEYFWNFGDTSGAYLGADLNIPAMWKDTNKAKGWKVGHVYNDVGSYTWIVGAYEKSSGRYGFATGSVTVTDEDAAYPTTDTIVYVPPLTNMSGYTVPTGAQIIDSWGSVRGVISALTNTQRRRVLIPNNVAITNQSMEIPRIGLGVIYAPLDPNGPSVQWVSTNETDLSRRVNYNDQDVYVSFRRIKFTGSWDAATERGFMSDGVFILGQSRTRKRAFLYHRCEFDGCINGIKMQQPANDETVTVSDTIITNYQDYGLYFGEDTADKCPDTYVIGCSIFSKPDGLTGHSYELPSPPSDRDGLNLRNAHNPLRYTSGGHLSIQNTYLGSFQGWSDGGLFRGRPVSVRQGALRVNTDADQGFTMNVYATVFEGAIWAKGNVGSPFGTVMVIDQALFVSGSGVINDAVCQLFHDGGLIRNAVFIAYPHPQIGTDDIFFEGNNAKYYNITIADMRSAAQMTRLNDWAPAPEDGVDNTVVNNIAIHTPARGDAVAGPTLTASAFLDGFAPKCRGPRYGFNMVEYTLTADVLIGGSVTVPYSLFKTIHYTSDLALLAAAPSTTQAYWQLHEDTDTFHRIGHKMGEANERRYVSVSGGTPPGPDEKSQSGAFSLSFDAGGITITNTSADDWTTGETFVLDFDRTSYNEDFDPDQDSTAVVLNTIALTDPLSNASGDAGLVAVGDYAGNFRPATGNRKGALGVGNFPPVIT